MATSGTYTFAVTRDDIIRQAMLTIGKLDPFESPDPQQTQDLSFVLNMMCKQWMGRADFAPGLKVWTRKHGHLFLSNTTGRYTIGPAANGWTNDYTAASLAATGAASSSSVTLSSLTGVAVGYFMGIVLDSGDIFWTTVATAPSVTITLAAPLPSQASLNNAVFVFQNKAQQPLLIETVSLRDIYNQDTPVRIMPTVQDYDYLSNKADPTEQQDPTAIYYENQLGNSYLYINAGAALDVTKHLAITYMEPVQDFNSPLDNPYYPVEWYLPLCLGLAKLAAPQFNRPWSQLQQDNFDNALAIAQNKDAEKSSLFFQCGEEE
jgi:hypothetical protein